jgi:hypothetical protein
VSRHLCRLDDVHVIGTGQPFAGVFPHIAEDPAFHQVSDELGPFITPLSPDTWRSPRDVDAGCIYSWTAPTPAALI